MLTKKRNIQTDASFAFIFMRSLSKYFEVDEVIHIVQKFV